MDIERAKEILAILADGVNPVTGEILPDNDSANQVEVVRALNAVLISLDKSKKPSKKDLPENAGKPWAKADEALLCHMFDQKRSKADICTHLKRTQGSIAAKLVRLGKIQDREAFRKME